MLVALKQLQQILSQCKEAWERSFFGESSTRPAQWEITCLAKIVDDLILVENFSEVLPRLSIASIEDRVVVLVAPHHVDPSPVLVNCNALLVRPTYLEDVMRMLACVPVSDPVVIMIDVCQLPSVHERGINDADFSYERALARMLADIKHLPGRCVVIEHEAALSKKNRALIRRVFEPVLKPF